MRLILMIDYSFNFEIPNEIVTKISIDTDILIDPNIKITMTYSPESKKYHISEINDFIVIKNPELRLLDGDVFESSLDIYLDEEI